MKNKLQNDIFLFSGLKTHAQLLEATTLLIDKDSSKIRSYDSFANEFNRLNRDYNQNYLEAEYQFAISSSQAAANWAEINEGGRYDLQYRTANDDRVRNEHQALHNTTLPPEDDFWLLYYPPNGWRCRCTVVEVLKSKYELSDSDAAAKVGELATTQIGKDGKNKLEIFRFNPGAEEKIFPPKHPYNKVKDADKVKKELAEENIFEDTIEKLKKVGVEYNEVKPLKKSLTEEEIISRVGGGDLTRGSCASLSFAYAGNKLGLDVLDFRDGNSRSFFAMSGNLKNITEKVGGFLERESNDFKGVQKLLPNVKMDKEYILITGAHAAVIRKSKENGLQYLELQSPVSNGYKALTTDVLKNRFDCKKSRTSYGTKIILTSMLIDIEKLNNNSFRELLGYINTTEDKQVKGSRGRLR